MAEWLRYCARNLIYDLYKFTQSHASISLISFLFASTFVLAFCSRSFRKLKASRKLMEQVDLRIFFPFWFGEGWRTANGNLRNSLFASNISDEHYSCASSLVPVCCMVNNNIAKKIFDTREEIVRSIKY